MKQYRNVDLATDREVVLYCASPGEARSARVAIALRQRGFEHVWPLASGLQAWRSRGFAVTTDVRMLPSLEHAVNLLREVLQYSRANAAQMLNTSDADIDRRLERAMRCIGSAS
jgi:3-mercaptopyruvate sulfurtransferase SseA